MENSPVKINIKIETESLQREAFYNMCFITENDLAPRTLVVTRLKDLLDNGYERTDLAYNFCVGVFAQQSMPSVFIRAKRKSESYEEAFDAADNSSYYFLVIQSKDVGALRNFNTHVNSADRYKLHFFSSPENTLVGSRAVHYFQKYDKTDISDFFSTNDFFINKAYFNYDTSHLLNENSLRIINELGSCLLIDFSVYKDYFNPKKLPLLNESSLPLINELGNYLIVDSRQNTFVPVSSAQKSKLAYPEAAWIAACGNSFPSRVQWLYKYLAKVDVNKEDAPELSTTSKLVYRSKSTMGSGLTCQGIVIHEQVGLDWITWALSKNVWNVLYNKDKVDASEGGLELIKNNVKQVLDIAVEESLFSNYIISGTKLGNKKSSASVTFKAELMQTILNSEVEGSLYY